MVTFVPSDPWDVRTRTGVPGHRATSTSTCGRDAAAAPDSHHPGMISGIGRRLRSTLDRESRSSDDDASRDGTPGAGASVSGVLTPAGVLAPSGPLVEFVAYGEDCLLAGRLRLASDRLTDLLNSQDEYELVDLVAERLSDGHAASVSALRVPRNELLLVQAAGPRGDANRRLRTRPYPVAAKLGPYRVRGQLHARPGVDPEVVIHRRGPMVPLTEAWLERPVGEERDLYRIGTVVLNRDKMDWVMATWEDSSEWLDADPVDPATDQVADPDAFAAALASASASFTG